jgi:hypothetical protein
METVKSENNNDAPMTVETFREAAKPEGFDLAGRLPVWTPKRNVAINGWMLGIALLPSAQPNQKHWTCFVFKLSQPTLVVDPPVKGAPPPAFGEAVKFRVAQPGETVLVTATASLQRLEETANDRESIFNVYLKPGGTEKTKRGTNVNVYESIVIGESRKRPANLRLPSVKLADALLPPAGGTSESGASDADEDDTGF